MTLFQVVVCLALAQQPHAPMLSEEAPASSWELPATLAQEERRDAASSSEAFDFDHAEIGADFSLLFYSSDFKAKTNFGGTLLARAPSPWFSRDLLGLDHDDFGAFFQLTVGGLDRNKLDNLDQSSGTTVFVSLGADYTIYRDATFLAMADLGIQYGYFGGVTDVHNGVALLLGLRGGVQVTDHVWFMLSPEITIGNSASKVFFVQIGVQYSF